MNETNSCRLRFAHDIYHEFNACDSDTRLRKAGIRSVVNKGEIHSFTMPDSKRLIDLDSFIDFFSNKAIQENVLHVPRLRYYENCYHMIHSEFPDISLSWAQLHEIVHSGEIFVLKHGTHYIVNYDELIEKLK